MTPEPASAGAIQTLDNLKSAEIPVNDPLDLAERLLGKANISETVAAKRAVCGRGQAEVLGIQHRDERDLSGGGGAAGSSG